MESHLEFLSNLKIDEMSFEDQIYMLNRKPLCFLERFSHLFQSASEWDHFKSLSAEHYEFGNIFLQNSFQTNQDKKNSKFLLVNKLLAKDSDLEIGSIVYANPKLFQELTGIKIRKFYEYYNHNSSKLSESLISVIELEILERAVGNTPYDDDAIINEEVLAQFKKEIIYRFIQGEAVIPGIQQQFDAGINKIKDNDDEEKYFDDV